MVGETGGCGRDWAGLGFGDARLLSERPLVCVCLDKSETKLDARLHRKVKHAKHVVDDAQFISTPSPPSVLFLSISLLLIPIALAKRPCLVRLQIQSNYSKWIIS